MNAKIEAMQKHEQYLENLVEEKRSLLKIMNDNNDDLEKRLALSEEIYVLKDEIYNISMEISKEMRADMNKLLNNSGRPKVGTKRSVSLTLPDESWEQIDKIIADEQNKLGTVIRDLVLQSLSEK